MVTGRTAWLGALLAAAPIVAWAGESGKLACGAGETARTSEERLSAFLGRYDPATTEAATAKPASGDDRFSEPTGSRRRPAYKGVIPPRMPDEALRQGLRGLVSAVVAVDGEGKVLDVLVVCSSDPMFDQPSINSLFKSWFDPAAQAASSVPGVLRVPIEFRP